MKAKYTEPVISKTMAAILVEQKRDLVVDEIMLPSELYVGQVLVEIHVSGICGSQLGEINGVKGPDRFLPHLMGHEGYATVLETGIGVKNVEKGDKVVLHWRPGSGIQSDTPKYKWQGKTLNAGWVTTFNKHAIVSENRCTKVPKTTPPDLAALFGCAITTGLGVIENNINLRIGETIVVYGAGGIGLNIIQGAVLRSASKIIAVDLYDSRLRLAESIGATHTINSKIYEPEQEIVRIMGDMPIDVFVDNTGLPNIIEKGYRITHNKGKVVLVGVPKKDDNVNINTLPLHFGKTIIGSHGGESKPSEDIPRYLRLLENNKLQTHKMISKRFGLEDINLAIKAMRSGNTSGRVMIDL